MTPSRCRRVVGLSHTIGLFFYSHCIPAVQSSSYQSHCSCWAPLTSFTVLSHYGCFSPCSTGRRMWKVNNWNNGRLHRKGDTHRVGHLKVQLTECNQCCSSCQRDALNSCDRSGTSPVAFFPAGSAEWAQLPVSSLKLAGGKGPAAGFYLGSFSTAYSRGLTFTECFCFVQRYLDGLSENIGKLCAELIPLHHTYMTATHCETGMMSYCNFPHTNHLTNAVSGSHSSRM